MKTNRYTLMFVLAATCSAAHAQDAFRNLALVEATSAPATTAPTAGGDFFSQPVSTSQAAAATTVATSTPKDTSYVPKTFSSSENARPAYEGRTTRRSTAPAPATSGKEGTVEPVAYEETDSATDLSFQVEAGYYTRYFYHGLDQIDNSTDDSSDVMMLGVSGTWEGFFLGYKYALATDKNTAIRDATVNERYSEHIFEAGYSVGLLPQGWFDVTASYQYIIFGEDAFWNNGAQGRIMLKAEMNRFQWFRPSIAYYRFEGIDERLAGSGGVLDGEQLIYQIQGGGQIYEYGPVAFGVSYYVLAGMDNEYNNSRNDFGDLNYYQAGISFPIIYQNLTVSPSFHYFEAKDQGTDYDETWVGLNAIYRF
jgi:hypothetical protein